MLRNGTPAPDFTLPDADETPRTLAALHGGKPTLLYFFRMEACPSARRDLARYVESHNRITSFGANLAAISADSTEHLRSLRDRLGVDFPLLSDPDFTVSESYGVYRSDETEPPQPHGEPAVFILDVDGNIAYSQVQTGPKGSAPPDALALILYYMSQHGGRY